LGERIGLSFPLGAGIITLQMFLLGILRVPLTLFNTTAPVFVELAGLAIWILSKKILLIPNPKLGLLAEFTSSENHWVKKCAFAVLALWIVAKLGSVFLLTGLRPIYSWDAWSVWCAAAKIFYNAHSLLLDASPQDFFGKNAVDRIIFYPLHSMLIQVWMSLWIGKFDEVLVKFHSPTYLLSMAICFYYITAREINRLFALALLAVVLSSPLMSYHAIELNSDLMLGVYLFLASASFLKAMRGNAAYWVLTGIYSSAALFTKIEALFFVLPFLMSAIVYFRFNGTRDSKKFAHIALLFTPFLTMIPWYVFQLYYGLGLSAMADFGSAVTTFYFGANSVLASTPLSDYLEILGGYFFALVSLNNFNVIIFFLPLLLIAHGKLTKESLYLLFPVACYMLFFLMLYMFTLYRTWFLLGTVSYRNALTYFPTLCLLTVLLLKKYATAPPMRYFGTK
jgi:4-amino-4-deoxy-L-arabinose transferase-like glycosyltransferase